MKQNNVSSKNGFAGCRYRAAIVTGKAGTAAAATASSLMRSQSFVEFFVQPEMFLFYILQHFVCLRFCFVVNCDSWHAIQQWQHSCRFLFLLKHSSCVVIINSNDYRKVEEFWKERNELLQDSYGSAACVSAHLSTAGCHDQFADRLLALAHEHAFSHFSHALCFEIVAFSFRIFYSTFYSL